MLKKTDEKKDYRDREKRRVVRHKRDASFFGRYTPEYYRPSHDVYVSEHAYVDYYEPTVYKQSIVTSQPAPEARVDGAHIFYGTNDCFIDETGRLICPAGSYVVKK